MNEQTQTSTTLEHPGLRAGGEVVPGAGAECVSLSGVFPSTHWSAIVRAGGGGASADAALAELCGAYWYPLYAFVRRRGAAPDEAADRTQGFFEHLVATGLVRKADRQKGRFRSFLLGCLRLYLESAAERGRALKRGGGAVLIPLDADGAERRLSSEVATTAAPDRLFDRHWAVVTLEAALARLETEMNEAGRAEWFRQLLPLLQGDAESPSHAELARRLGTTESAVTVTLYRLRRRYRELLHATVARTLNDPRDADDELGHLLAALRG